MNRVIYPHLISCILLQLAPQTSTVYLFPITPMKSKPTNPALLAYRHLNQPTCLPNVCALNRWPWWRSVSVTVHQPTTTHATTLNAMQAAYNPPIGLLYLQRNARARFTGIGIPRTESRQNAPQFFGNCACAERGGW